MLRSLLCDGRRLQHFQDCGPWDREHLRDLGLPQRQRAGLVEDDGPHSAERLQVDTTLDDRADARRAPDAAEDGQRRSGCDATGACHDDDGDGGSDVARYEERETGARECEVDEVTGEAVGRFLDRGPRLLGTLDGFDDVPKRGVAPDPGGADLHRSRLVDRARENLLASQLLDRHRLAGDGGLVHEGVPASDDAIDRDARAGLDQDDLAHLKLVGRNLMFGAAPANERDARQEIDELLDGLATAGNREPFQHLGHQDEEHDHERGEELPDDRGRADGDGHGQFHRHAALEKGFEGLAPDRPAADQQSGHCRRVEA